jgi:hypothetical protein
MCGNIGISFEERRGIGALFFGDWGLVIRDLHEEITNHQSPITNP